jgi:hypothetical protein
LTRVKEIIKLSGRKSYMFLIGKINPAKLLNFPEIDVFVLVACPENSLLDSKILFKPVVTPYELELALIEDRQWNGQYSADFRDLLEDIDDTDNIDDDQDAIMSEETKSGSIKGGDGVVVPISLKQMKNDYEMGSENDSDDDSNVYMSLVDGKLHNKRGRMLDKKDTTTTNDKNDKNDKNDNTHNSTQKQIESGGGGGGGGGGGSSSSGGVLSSLNSSSFLSGNDISAMTLLPAKDASDYMLRMREYKGLEQRLGMDAPHTATEGMSGIAWDYHEAEKIQQRLNTEQENKKGKEEGKEVVPELEDVVIVTEEVEKETNNIGGTIQQKKAQGGSMVGGGSSSEEEDEDASVLMSNPGSLSLFGNLSSDSSDDDED